MSDDNKSRLTPRKPFPGGFFLFLMAAVLMLLTVQNLTPEPTGKVGFSYQAESLVNLDLLQPEFSQKIAQNDNLVTFSGKFRNQETDEGKARFKYLDLLNQNHML